MANDSAVSGVGGSWRRLSGESRFISMERESVLIELDQTNSYQTTADFTFHNKGPAQTVEMGFPESGAGDIPGASFERESGFKWFKTWVNGGLTPVSRRRPAASELEYKAFWVKRVAFGSGETKKVRVRYRAPFGTMADPIPKFCSYDFTGGNWAGKIKESVLTIRMARPGAYLVAGHAGRTKPQFLRRGANFHYIWRNWEAEETFTFHFGRTVPGWLSWPEQDPRNRGFIPVTIPGAVTHGPVDWLPPGFMRNGKAYVGLRAWQTAIKAKVALEIRADGEITRVRWRNKEARLSKRENGPILVSNSWAQTLYAPVALLQRSLGANFGADAKAHALYLPE